MTHILIKVSRTWHFEELSAAISAAPADASNDEFSEYHCPTCYYRLSAGLISDTDAVSKQKPACELFDNTIETPVLTRSQLLREYPSHEPQRSFIPSPIAQSKWSIKCWIHQASDVFHSSRCRTLRCPRTWCYSVDNSSYPFS